MEQLFSDFGFGLFGRLGFGKSIRAEPLIILFDQLIEIGLQLLLRLGQIVRNRKFHVANLNLVGDAVVSGIVRIELRDRLRRRRNRGQVI